MFWSKIEFCNCDKKSIAIIGIIFMSPLLKYSIIFSIQIVKVATLEKHSTNNTFLYV